MRLESGSMKIRWVRKIETATCGLVSPGDVSDVVEADAARYVANGWAVIVPTVKPAKKVAKDDG